MKRYLTITGILLSGFAFGQVTTLRSGEEMENLVKRAQDSLQLRNLLQLNGMRNPYVAILPGRPRISFQSLLPVDQMAGRIPNAGAEIKIPFSGPGVMPNPARVHAYLPPAAAIPNPALPKDTGKHPFSLLREQLLHEK